MRPRTTENYHRAEDDDVRRQAAQVLREVFDTFGNRISYVFISQKRRIVSAARRIRMKPEPNEPVPAVELVSSEDEVFPFRHAEMQKFNSRPGAYP